MKVIGVTGSLGSGKSTVSGIFQGLGAYVIDADKIAHKVLRKGTESWRGIRGLFNGEILTASGSINKKKLANIVFNDKRKLKLLESCVHPFVISYIENKISLLRVSGKYPVVVIDAPLLIEAGLDKYIDCLVVVEINKRLQVSRLIESRKMDKSLINRILTSQLPLREKCAMADYVISNNGTKTYTRRQTEKIWHKIMALKNQVQ